MRDFDRRERADVPIVVAAMRHRIDVRAEEKWFERGVAPRTAADDVPGEIDARLELGGAHQVEHESAAGAVVVAVGYARDATLGIPAELRQGCEVRIEPLTIYTEIRLCVSLRERPARRHEGRGKSASHD